MADQSTLPVTETYSTLPQISLATENVQPPAGLMVGQNDQLVCQLITSSTTFSASFFARLLLADGTISQYECDITGNGLRTSKSVSLQLADGFLLSVAVISTGANAPRGAMFARVLLLRGFPQAILWNQVLLAAYCTLFDIPTWPPVTYEPTRTGQGNLRTIVGSTPAAGADISETVPNFAIWRVISFRYLLTTSAAVANRSADLIVDDGIHTLAELPPSSVQAASLTIGYTWAPSLVAATANGQQTNPLPMQLFVSGGYRLRTNTAGLQAGDQYSAPQYLVEEWMGL